MPVPRLIGVQTRASTGSAEILRMTPRATMAIVTSFFVWTSLLAAGLAGDFDHSHPSYGEVLGAFVKDGFVNYAALKTDRKELDTCLDQLAKVPEPEFKQWTKPQQVAFLINLYNAATLQLIIDHYPIKSIRDIGAMLRGPWKQPVVRLLGKQRTSVFTSERQRSMEWNWTLFSWS